MPKRTLTVGGTGFEPDAPGLLTSSFTASGTSVGLWWAHVSITTEREVAGLESHAQVALEPH